MEIKEYVFKGIHYLVRLPKNYAENVQYPTVLFLHGAGSRGNDISVLRENPFFTLTADKKDFPFVIIAPQCHADTWFDIWETLKEFALYIKTLSYVDSDRVYGIGASMGGYGTWQMAMSMPSYYAAIVPICGGGMYWNAWRLKKLPVWAFHGAKDQTVFVEESIKMVDKIKSSGGNPKLTIYPENTHDAWTDTYLNDEVYKWFLEHKNKNEQEQTTKLEGSKLFG